MPPGHELKNQRNPVDGAVTMTVQVSPLPSAMARDGRQAEHTDRSRVTPAQTKQAPATALDVLSGP